MGIKREDLITLFDCVFEKAHSDSFKVSEMKMLLKYDDYWFNETPKSNWKSTLNDKLRELGYDNFLKK